MVGSLGEAELAAVGVAAQIYSIHWMVMFGFTSGSSTYMAQFWGANDLASIKKTTGFAMAVCFPISFCFFLLAMFCPSILMSIFTNIPEMIELGSGYVRMASFTFLTISITVPFTAALRTTQQTHLPLIISLFVFSTNTFLNYVFIFGHFGAPKMGVAGAAFATLIARCLELCLILFVVFGKKNIVAGRFKEYFGWPKALITRVLKNAIPTTANETLWSLGTSMYVAAYARMGVTEYASIQAANVINNLFIMAGFSIGDATLILVGQKLGEGKLDYAYALGSKLLKTGAAIGVCAGGLLILLSKPIISMFELTPEGQRYTFLILVIAGVFMGLSLYNGINITGVLRCGGDALFAMGAEMCTIWLYGVPIAFLAALVWKVPVYIVFLLVKLEDVIKGVILIKRFLSKKWVNNVINDIH